MGVTTYPGSNLEAGAATPVNNMLTKKTCFYVYAYLKENMHV